MLDLNSLISSLALLVAIFSLAFETRRSRLTLQAELILKLSERFVNMRPIRKQACKNILAGKFLINSELSEILDFFSDISYLLLRGALDKRLAYDSFSYWIFSYWQCAENYVVNQRKIDSESWATLEKVIRQFEKEANKRGYSPAFSPNEITIFTKEEASLKL